MAWLHVVFGPDSTSMSWWQMCARSALIFLVGIGLIRLSGQRTFSQYSALDTIVTILVGSNLSRALTGNASLIPTLVGSVTIVVLHRSLARASVGSKALSRLLAGTAFPLVRDGRPNADMRRRAVGDDDLAEAMRLHGFDDVAEIRVATLERNGHISVVKR